MPIVILAGGAGQRMGGVDKCLLSLGAETLLARLLRVVQAQSPLVLLNANGDAARFADVNLPFVPDRGEPGAGPLAGVLASMDYLQQRFRDQSSGDQNNGDQNSGDRAPPWLLTVAGDCPFVPGDLLKRLHAPLSHAEYANSEIIYARSAGRDHFVIALWSLALRGPLEEFLAAGERSVGKFIHGREYAVVDFDASPRDPFFNINTPEQLLQAQAWVEREVSPF